MTRPVIWTFWFGRRGGSWSEEEISIGDEKRSNEIRISIPRIVIMNEILRIFGIGQLFRVALSYYIGRFIFSIWVFKGWIKQ